MLQVFNQTFLIGVSAGTRGSFAEPRGLMAMTRRFLAVNGAERTYDTAGAIERCRPG